MRMLARLSENLVPNPLQNLSLDLGLLWLRASLCVIMILSHGWPKFVNFTERAESFPDPLGVGSTVSLALAVFSEVFCAALVVLGFATRLVIIPLIVTMVVAFFIVHAEDPWARKQMAMMFLIPFLALFFTGPGRFSVDRLLR